MANFPKANMNRLWVVNQKNVITWQLDITSESQVGTRLRMLVGGEAA